jgi:hypothetical protein
LAKNSSTLGVAGERLAGMSHFWESVENFWNKNQALAWILAILGLGGSLWAALNPQSPGVSIGLLALSAGIMSIRPQMHTAEKTAWMLTLIAFTVLEVRAIKRSDHENIVKQVEQNDKFQGIAEGLNTAITISREQFKNTMDAFTDEQKSRQQQFDATMTEFSATSAAENARFVALVNHEEKLSEAQTGLLTAGKEPTPPYSCGLQPPPDATLVFIGKRITWHGLHLFLTSSSKVRALGISFP